MQDYAIPPDATEQIEAFVELLSSVPEKKLCSLIMAEVMQRAGLHSVLVALPEDFDTGKFPTLHAAIQNMVKLIHSGVYSNALIDLRPVSDAWHGIATPEHVDRNKLAAHIQLAPHGGSFHATSCGPLDLRLPHWIPHSIAVDIAGLLWRVLRFCVNGMEVREDMQAVMEEILLPHKLSHMSRQAAAISFLRWALTGLGVGVYDIYGREWIEHPVVDYSVLFKDDAELMGPRLRAMVREFRVREDAEKVS